MKDNSIKHQVHSWQDSLLPKGIHVNKNVNLCSVKHSLFNAFIHTFFASFRSSSYRPFYFRRSWQ